MTEIQWYIAGRQQGKTTDLITWVKGGHKVSYYPYWDRVIITSSIQEANLIRRQLYRADSVDGLEYNMVYHWEDWKNANHGTIRGRVEIGIDNVDFFLNRMLFINTSSTIVRATATGTTQAWPEVIERDNGDNS